MRIVTDSAADLTPAEAQQLDVTLAPLYIKFPDGEVRASDLTPDQFYDRLRAMAPQIPTTAQPSPGVFKDIYQKLAQAGDKILSIHISSGLSGTLQSARLAAQQAVGLEVTPVDSLTLSGGQRYQVLAAALAARAGESKAVILDRLERIRAATEVAYTLETLEYLARGGRIGRVQALAGALLKIKPIIRVDKADGKYTGLGRGRTLSHALGLIVDHLAHTYGTSTPLWATVLHGQLADRARELGEALRARLPVARLEVLRISPALGVHTGPGIVGVSAVPMGLMEDVDRQVPVPA
jgi:DegV family protein with EDD domain